MVSRYLTIAAVLISFAVRADEKPTFSVDVNVVNIFASVRDHDGAIITDLAKEDFILTEDGQEQEIRYFGQRADLPLTIGLVVDTSLSQKNVLEIQRRASYDFLDQVLRPEQDEAFVISFDVEVELLQDLTNSRKKLERALNALELPDSPLHNPRHRRRFAGRDFQQWPGGGGGWPGGGGGWPGGGGTYPRGPSGPTGPPGPTVRGGSKGMGTTLYDSVFLASDEILGTQSGRKAIILISDGVDMGSKVGRYDSIEAAQRADTIVYSIRYYDDMAYGQSDGRRGGRGGRRPDANREGVGLTALEQMSFETGGRMFEVQDGLPLAAIFELIQEELRNQYSIGYTPATATAEEFRKIKLTVKDDTLRVQARTGRYSDGVR